MSDTILTGGDQGAGDPGQGAGGEELQFSAWTDQVQKESLNDDLKGHKTLTDFVKHYQGVKTELETTKASVKDYVKLPGENATPEELTAYRGKMGVPESADKYELKPGDLPEGVSMDENLIGEFKKLAFDNGLSQKQAQELLSLDIQRKVVEYNTYKEEKDKEVQEGVKLLKEKHGEKFDEKIIHAMRIISKLGGDELKKELEDTGWGNNPKLIDFIMNVSEAYSEDGVVIGSSLESDAVNLDKVYEKSMNHLPSGRR